MPSSHPITMASTERYSYSPNSPDLAVSTSDGRLIVYDTSLSSVKSEFVPSSHLSSSACTCVSWRPPKEARDANASSAADGTPGKRPRKRKNSLSGSSEKLNGSTHDAGASDHIALGTTSGSIVLYSVKTSEVKTTHDKAHSDRINDIAWADSGIELFTCSSDGCVGRFVVKKSSFSKFRPEGLAKKRQGLFSLALHPSQSSALLGATAKVLWVDLDTQSTLGSFTGHLQGDVKTLRVFGGASAAHVMVGGVGDKDRVISVWKLEEIGGHDSNGDNSNAVAASGPVPSAIFDTNDSVKSAFVSENEKDGDWMVGALTKSGVLHCFNFNPNDAGVRKKKKGKPIKPKSTVQIASDKDATTQKVRSIPILAGKMSTSSTVNILHGSHAKPNFETLDLDKLDKLTVLVRSVGADTSKRQMGAKVMIADTSSVSVLTKASAQMSNTSGMKRKSMSGGKVDDLPMLDRLRLLSRETEHITTPPRTDSLLHLLLQGLHNKDRKILDSVLDRADIELIDKTVCKLPVEGVIPLINELQHYIKGRGMVNQSHAKWLRSVLQHHSSYLMSSTHCDELLGPIVAMLQARTKHYAPLINLKGKLDVMTRQIRARPEAIDSETAARGQSMGTELNAANEARLIYQDDSSDEMSDVLDELLPPASDTEEQWNLNNADESSSEGGEMEAEGEENGSDVESESEDQMVNGAGGMDDENESVDEDDDGVDDM